MTFSPDGSMAFWVEWNGAWGSSDASQHIIYMSRQQHGVWSKPTPAPFTQNFSDDDPFVSPDGRWIYFVSDRPSSEDDEKPDADIWRYSLIEKGRLEHLSINSESEEYSPVVTASGALYFASARDGGLGEGDLYRAAPMGNGFHAPERLNDALNSLTGEWNLWVSADESEIVFEASSRPTNVSTPGDLYYSWRTPSGWTAAVPVEDLNSSDSDLMPRLHPDGETLYYTTAPIGEHARIATAAWGPLSARARAAYAPTLLVANRSSHEITWVDLARGEVVARVATGEGPHFLSNVSDGRVLATGYGEFPKPHSEPVSSRPPFVEVLNSRMTLIDTVGRNVLLDTIIEDCARPHASWVVGPRGYVTCESERRVLVLDLENGRTIGHFDTLQNGSHVLSFEPESRTLAVSNTGSGSVTLINIDSGDKEVVKLAAGSEGSLAIAGRIWVGNATNGSISIIDPRSSMVVEQIDSVCRFPIALSHDSQGQVWVACFASAELVSIDPESFAIRRRIGLGDQPLNLLIHPERKLAYVSLPRRNAIAEINLDTGMELRRIPVGIEPDGLRWATLDH
jgi:DNA-binding beta-propeller fold protein YncE